MLTYIKTLINIALKKLGPEDLPDSKFLLAFTFVFYLVIDVPLTAIAFGPSMMLLQVIVLDMGFLIACLWILLRLSGLLSRFRQTLTALLGTSALLNILISPFSFWREVSAGTSSESALPVIGIFAIVLWSLSIDGHILSRAISKSYSIGLGIAVVYFILNTFVLRSLILADAPG